MFCVQNTLYRDHDGRVYQEFLNTLSKAKRENWESKRVRMAIMYQSLPRSQSLDYVFAKLYAVVLPFVQIFKEVDAVLKPWPHLVKLFLHFLTPQDCTEMNMVSRISIIV